MAGQHSQVERVIVDALQMVVVPGGKSLVDAGVVIGFEGSGDSLVVKCRNPGWPEPVRQRLDRQVAAAIQSKLSQIGSVNVEWRDAPIGTPGSPPSGSPSSDSQSASVESSLDIRHVIAVGSGKGGVGKSTIAASLAYGLKHRGHRVGLMDADVYGPSIPHMLGIDVQPRVVDNKYHPPFVDGMPVMSMGFLVAPEQAVIWRGPMLHKAVRDFLFSVAWGSLDFLVVDLPPGTGDVVLSLSQQLPIAGGVIVCTPQEVALLDARKALSMLGTVKIPCLGIVENMSYFIDPTTGNRTDIFGHGGAEHWAAIAGVPFLGGVPIDVQIRVNGDSGEIRKNLTEESASREPLLAIADRLLESLARQSPANPPAIEVIR